MALGVWDGLSHRCNTQWMLPGKLGKGALGLIVFTGKKQCGRTEAVDPDSRRVFGKRVGEPARAFFIVARIDMC